MTSRRPLVLIFAHPRSGSTTLADVLNLHPEITICHEPFAEQPVAGLEGVDATLEAVVREPWCATGIKHVYNLTWPFQSERAYEYNEHLLLHPDWLPVLLWRRNLFAAALSNAIAMQLDAWDNETSRPLLGRGRSLNPIPPQSLRDHISAMERDLARYRDCLTAAGKQFLEITYEELYGGRVPPDEKIAAVNAIIRAAGYDEVTDEEALTAMSRMLSTDNKLNNRTTYNLIPNFEELRRAFGSYAEALS